MGSRGPELPARVRAVDVQLPSHPVGTLITQRGCPFSCTFCDRSTSGAARTLALGQYVVRMMRQMADYGVGTSLFYDDLFTVNKARVRQLCEAMLDHRLDFTWSWQAT